ncbi:MAG: iron ABC transporter permease [Nocardioides sp.]|uniref:ABC transporter permease n=1 Tax=Nocardioides sp. TaxID=35761 RepID=UPI0039E460FF
MSVRASRIRSGLLRPGRWSGMGVLAAVLLLGIVFLVAYPLLRTVIGVVGDESGTGDLSGLNSSIWRVLWNTVRVVGLGSLLGLIGGATLAWINERTDGGLKGLGDFMPVAPLMLPSITGVLGWVVLCDPRVGMANVVLRSILGRFGVHPTTGPIDIYTMYGLIAVTALHLVPIVYLIVSAALRNLDPAIEEASRISGAGPFATAVKVTLPAVAPSLASAWILGVINGISLFSVPVIIGTGARIDVLSVEIWRYLTDYPPKQGAALILAAGMLVVVIGLRLLERTVIKQGRQATIGGRGVRASTMSLGKARYLTKGLVWCYVLVAVVLPVLGLLMVSLEPFWSPTIEWSKLSLHNYTEVLTDNPLTFRALKNSLLLGAVGATVTMLIAAFLMLYAHQRREPTRRLGPRKRSTRSPRPGRMRRTVDLVTSLPATIPHSLIGVSFILAFSQPPLRLYGTLAILVLAHVMMQIPYAASAAGSAVSTIGRELGEASRIFGATERRTMRTILLPLVLPGLTAGWILVFIHVLGEVTASALLSGTSNPVVGAVLLDLWNQGNFPAMTALAIMVWLISSILVLVMIKVGNRRVSAARG